MFLVVLYSVNYRWPHTILTVDDMHALWLYGAQCYTMKYFCCKLVKIYPCTRPLEKYLGTCFTYYEVKEAGCFVLQAQAIAH